MEKPNIGNPRILLSALPGGVFGLSVYSYWLVDILPPASLQILVYFAFLLHIPVEFTINTSGDGVYNSV